MHVQRRKFPWFSVGFELLADEDLSLAIKMCLQINHQGMLSFPVDVVNENVL